MSTEQFPQIKYPANPLNWFRLLRWILFKPEVFLGKTQNEWPDDLSKTLNWLDTLLFGPLLIVSVGFSTSLLPISSNQMWVYQLWIYRLILLSAVWVGVPLLYWINRVYWTDCRGQPHWGVKISSTLMRMIILGFTLGIADNGVLTLPSIVNISVMSGLTVSAIDITPLLKMGSRQRLFHYLMQVVWFVVFLITMIVVTSIVANDIWDYLSVFLLYIAYLFGQGAFGSALNKNILQSRVTAWNYVTFIHLVGTWLFLIWYCWLGGYAVLAS